MRMRLLTVALAGVCLLVPGLAAAGSGRPDPAPPMPLLYDADGDKVAEDLADRLAQAGPDEALPVVVQLRAPDDAAVAVAVGPVPPTARWSRALLGFAATLTRRQIAALARVPAVQRIEPDREVRAFLNAATLWTGVQQARRDFGVDGDGDGNPRSWSRGDVVIAIVDTGIDCRHVDLDGGKVIGWRDEVAGRPGCYDDNGHGTHVASIATGTGEGNPAYTGVAPGAALVGVKVLDAAGSGSLSRVISGIEWVLANRTTYNIRVANLSLGTSGCSDGTDALSAAVNNAAASGIVMVVAAGNAGPNTCTVGSPAAAARAIAVGALHDPGEGGWGLADFSSRGPTADGRVKPDVAAPGANITAARAGSGNGYVTHSGTSMAAPFVAGVAALVLDANPRLSVDQVRSLLTGATRDYGPAGADRDYGGGILVAYWAVQRAGGFAGSFTDGLSHRHVEGNLARTGAYQDWAFTVTDPSRPLAITMVMAANPTCGWFSCSPDFDIYLYDPAGNQVAAATGTRRQDQIRVQPTRAGTYWVRVYSYRGSGSYYADISYR